MNRRSFLSFLGLAPVAAAVPAMALPRAEKPTDIDYDALSSDIRKMWVESIEKATGPQEATSEHIDHLAVDVHSANIGSITAGTIRTRNGIEMDMQAKEVRFTV